MYFGELQKGNVVVVPGTSMIGIVLGNSRNIVKVYWLDCQEEYSCKYSAGQYLESWMLLC